MIMNIKVCLVLFGALIALAFCTPAEKTLKNRLSEEIISKRHVRAAGSFGRKNEKKTKKNKKLRNDKKSNQKFKKNRKNNKKVKKNRKSNKKVKINRKKNKKSQKNTNRKPLKSKKMKKVKESDMGVEREIPESCYEVLTKYVESKKPANFYKQLSRIEFKPNQIEKKLTKAGDFKQSSADMEIIAPTCANPDDKLAAEILAAELGACETKITDSCQPPEINQIQIDTCVPIVKAFEDEKVVCFNAAAEAACDCWQSETLSGLFESLPDCVIKDSETNVKNRYKECIEAVKNCKKAQAEALSVYVNCSTSCPQWSCQTCRCPEERPDFQVIETLSEYDANNRMMHKHFKRKASHVDFAVVHQN